MKPLILQHTPNHIRRVHFLHGQIIQKKLFDCYLGIQLPLSWQKPLLVNFFDYYFCIRLTMTLFLMVVFLSFEFENSDFLLTTMFFNFSRNSSTFNVWRTNFNIFPTYEKYFVKRNSFINISCNFFYVNYLAFFNFNLFTTSFDNCVHNCTSLLNSDSPYR